MCKHDNETHEKAELTDLNESTDRDDQLVTDGSQATFGEDGSLETPDGYDTDLEDFGADVDHSQPETRLDVPTANVFGVDDWPMDLTSNDIGSQKQIVTDAEQSTIQDQHDEDTDDSDDRGIFEPIPESTRVAHGPSRVDERRLEGTGLCPWDLNHVANKMGWKLVAGLGYHPDDEEPSIEEETPPARDRDYGITQPPP